MTKCVNPSKGASSSTAAALHAVRIDEIAGAALTRQFSVYALTGHTKQVVVGVEYLINFGGLGQLINDLAERYDLPGVYAAICFVILVSVVFFMATERAERWLSSAE